MRKPGLLAALGLVLSVLLAAPARAGHHEQATLESAAEVLRTLPADPLTCIPPKLLHDAHAVAIIPNVVKAGFLVDGRFGHGVLLVRRPDGSWGEPVFIVLAGGGFGLQAGVQSTDVVLLFRTAKSVERVLRGKGKLTLGGDVAVAAGPVGREAEAATDLLLRAEIFSYSRSRGLFAGVSLQGAALHANNDANQAFYGPGGISREEAMAVGRIKEQLFRLGMPPMPALPVIIVPH
jgi:lipid-binding SYLF domain-containing protein